MRSHILVAALVSVALAGVASEPSSETFRRFEERFGAPIDSGAHIYELNRHYAVRPSFDCHGELVRVEVRQKDTYASSHPEWRIPDEEEVRYLLEVEFAKLVEELDAIKALGPMVRKHHGGGVVTSMQSWHIDEYANASIQYRVSVDLRQEPREEAEITSFEVLYFQAVEGRVAANLDLEDALGPNPPRVRIGKFPTEGKSREGKCNLDGTYVVSRSEYDRLSIGAITKFVGAGPLE